MCPAPLGVRGCAEEKFEATARRRSHDTGSALRGLLGPTPAQEIDDAAKSGFSCSGPLGVHEVCLIGFRRARGPSDNHSAPTRTRKRAGIAARIRLLAHESPFEAGVGLRKSGRPSAFPP